MDTAWSECVSALVFILWLSCDVWRATGTARRTLNLTPQISRPIPPPPEQYQFSLLIHMPCHLYPPSISALTAPQFITGFVRVRAHLQLRIHKLRHLYSPTRLVTLSASACTSSTDTPCQFIAAFVRVWDHLQLISMSCHLDYLMFCLWSTRMHCVCIFHCMCANPDSVMYHQSFLRLSFSVHSSTILFLSICVQ
jgi:hypothetical protein